VSVFNKYPPSSVLRCPTAAENGGYDQGRVLTVDLPSSPAYNVKSVTNTSCRLVQTTDDGRRGVLDARRHPSRLCFSHFATRTVDNTVYLYAAKPDIRPESRFLLTLPAFDTPLGWFSSECCCAVWHGKTTVVAPFNINVIIL